MGRKQASAVPPNLIAGLSAMSQASAIHLFYGITLRTRPGLIGILFPFFRLLMDVFPLTSAYRPRTLRQLSVTFHQATLPINAFHFILLKYFYVVVIPQFFLQCNVFLCFFHKIFMQQKRDPARQFLPCEVSLMFRSFCCQTVFWFYTLLPPSCFLWYR